MEINDDTAGSKRRLKKPLVLLAFVVLVAGWMLTVFWVPQPPAVVWLTRAEFLQAMRSPPPTVPARIRSWFRQWLPRESRVPSRDFDFRLHALRSSAIGEGISSSVRPVSTNSEGWQARVLPASEWSALHDRLTSSSGGEYFRPMRVPGLSGGGNGSVELADGPPRHYVFEYEAVAGDQGLTLTLYYRADEAGVTNVSLAFSAPVPIGGAVVLQKADGRSAQGLALLALEVIRAAPPTASTNRAARSKGAGNERQTNRP